MTREVAQPILVSEAVVRSIGAVHSFEFIPVQSAGAYGIVPTRYAPLLIA